jgi:hypothetical protein
MNHKETRRLHKRIFKRIHDQYGDKQISEEEFFRAYLAELAFEFVTTYGLPQKVVLDAIKESYECCPDIS